MAAVRSCSCVVYDLSACIEELAISAGLCDRRQLDGPLLPRGGTVCSFARGGCDRPLPRAERSGDRTRRAAGKHLSGPASRSTPKKLRRSSQDTDFLGRRFGLSPDAVAFFVPQFAPDGFAPDGAEQLSPAAVPCWKGSRWPRMSCRSMTCCWKRRRPRAGPSMNTRHAWEFQRTWRWCTSSTCRPRCESAHVVVALGQPPADPVAARQPNEICLKSLWQGKTLLAADLPSQSRRQPRRPRLPVV